MYIVQIASEVAPIAKVGGLADVMMGLSSELTRKGHDVRVLIPKYDCLTASRDLQLEKVLDHVPSYFQGQIHDNSIWQVKIDESLTVTLLEPHHSKRFFQRGAIYGFQDDIDRFIYFSRACLDFLKAEAKTPDVIHIHDWEAASIAFLIRSGEFKERFAKTKVVLTIHNMDYQGRCAEYHLEEIGYTGEKESFRHPNSTDVNLLKGAIVYADGVTTVSPTYAKEVLTDAGAKGLLDVMLQNKQKFSGILNGLDVRYWNPETDAFIPHHYSTTRIEPKKEDKWALFKELGMERKDDVPLLASVTRLVPQKGVTLIKAALQYSLELGIQFVLLGVAPDPRIEEEFVELAHKYKSHPDVRLILQNQEPLAHRLYAASDMLIVPSIFEPCGLTQLIALRYGSIPIVRRTGGLADTVFDVQSPGRPFEERNGFSFDSMDTETVRSTLKRAYQFWCEDKKGWNQLMKQGMSADYSWDKPAEQYLKLYT